MAVKHVYKGTVTSICSTPQPADLDDSEYAALTFIPIASVGSAGDWSTIDNPLTYDTVDEDVSGKQKGVRNAGDPVIEVARNAGDPGQDALRAAADTDDYYAFRRVLPDGTTQFSRGVVMGPARPGGGNEDFIVEQFTVGFVQKIIEVEA